MKEIENVKPTTDEIKSQILEPRKAKYKWIAGLLIVLGIAAFLLWRGGGNDTPVYQSEKVTRGDITSKASATGTLSPTREVSVGSEISGKIESVMVEENDLVKKGDVLAVFDKTTLESQLETARARA